jgi:hypothetical protein
MLIGSTFMRTQNATIAWVFVSIVVFWQTSGNAQRPVKHAPKKAGVTIVATPKQLGRFHPTCNLDSNSIGFYFFPANLGAKWTLRTISEYLDAQNKLLKSDTTFSFERVVSDSERTLQGLPVLGVESSVPYVAGRGDSAKVKRVEYYVDDSVIMTVINHSISNGQNHILLVNPLRLGASWKDAADDTIRTHIIATAEPVSTPIGDFKSALVVQTSVGFGELSKYFVPGVGIVPTIFRGIPPAENGTFVVTSELIKLERGNPKRSIRRQFEAIAGAPSKGKSVIKKEGKKK